MNIITGAACVTVCKNTDRSHCWMAVSIPEVLEGANDKSTDSDASEF